MIKESATSPIHLFRYLYARVNDEEKNIVQGSDNVPGGKACAFFVSGLLYMNKLCQDLHAGVDGLERDLLACGWQEISGPKAGAVLIWESLVGVREDQSSGRHSGFAISETDAVSNDSENGGQGFPIRHHLTYGTNPDGSPTRKIEKIYWHPNLDKETW